MTPFYDLYPKDPTENLEWRIRCRERAITDLRVRKALVDACMTDVLFWMAFACWSYEPRAKVKVRPFIPWPHQEPVFLAIDQAIDDSGEEKTIDVIVDKSRAQGGTYGYLWVDLRRWLRDPMFSAGFVTRNESLVDSKTDSSTVLWKVAWAIEKLPFWLVPEGWDPQKHRNLGQHTFYNPALGGLISGYAAGQDVAAGGRMTVFTIDEAGARDFVAGGKDYAVQEALHDVSNCIRMVSARYVDAGVFHEACENPDSSRNGVHLVLDWKDNPIHGKNSYVVVDDKPVARKPEDQAAVDAYHRENPDVKARLERKGFKYEGRVRSPWYDMRCLRPTSTPRLIASQLDRDPRGAVGKVFTSELLEKAKKGCRPPVWQGTPVFDSEDLELTGLLPRADGNLKLWFKPGADDSPPLGPFTVGCDMASGSDGAYSSNSVASILDDRTGEQVGEYAVKGMPLIKFARLVVGLCMWLRKAKLSWEDSGMSGPFAKEILEVIYYGNVYWREVPEIGSRRKSRKAGWGNRTNEDKANLFEQMALAMETGKYIPRSEELIKECGEYEWEDGKIIHAPTKNHAAKEVNHGDRCLVAGTMVTTDKGEVPIESISVGDLVVTRDGLRPVQCCGETGFEEVFRLTLSNGRTLTGTGNHPVWTENRSWVQLQSLLASDMLLACPQQQFAVASTSEIPPLRRSSSTAGRIIGTPRPSRGTEEFTSGEGASTGMGRRSLSMLRSGNITTAPSLLGILSTTKTRTRSTTTSPILSASRLPSMGRFTRTASIWQRIAARFCTCTGASIAGRRTVPSGSTARSSAVLSAASSTAQSCVSAQPAVTSTAPSRKAPRGTAQSNAQFVCVTKSERLARARVFNLSVAGTPEYFAQGVLVHNCIAAGVAWLVYTSETDGKVDFAEETSETPEYGSFLWRELREQNRMEAGSPEFGIRDVVNY